MIRRRETSGKCKNKNFFNKLLNFLRSAFDVLRFIFLSCPDSQLLQKKVSAPLPWAKDSGVFAVIGGLVLEKFHAERKYK